MMNYEKEYHIHQKLLHKIVWIFMRQNNIPLREHEEWFSQANLYFMIACHSYEGSQSKLSTWISIQVMGRLRKELSKRIFYANKNHSVADFNYHTFQEGHNRIVQEEWTEWPVYDIMDELNQEGKELLAMVKSGVLDLQKIFKGHRLGIKPVFLFLREQGWSRVKIHRSFKNVHKLIEKEE